MELDKRIIEGKRPLTCYEIEEAEKYVGKKCYITNNYDFFRNLDLTHQTILKGVENCEVPFHYDSDMKGEFCLPCEWVKQSEKKYRPFSLEEFLKIFDIGDQIEFRCKDNGEVKHTMFIGYADDDVMIGIYRYSLSYLFENYELQYLGHWQPFGILEE